MRTTRIIILCIFLSATLFVLVRSLGSRSTTPKTYPSPGGPRRSFLGFVYYNTPFSLFPPNAAISLTDDNSTSFAARPAAFGPKLASSGLSGPLWVGSGFAEDSVDGNGELGCSDIPGWEGMHAGALTKHRPAAIDMATSKSRTGRPQRTDDVTQKMTDDDSSENGSAAVKDDGTDNHLHAALGKGSLSRRDSLGSSHADIQSMQESAEIEGKVVLLMRGGCGFLEKVMWAQRRGAIAVIVGDNQRGGPLIQMFARGEETENVTIPSVFTARTTAQLLSSLTQPGSFIEDSIGDDGKPFFKVQRGGKPAVKRQPRVKPSKPVKRSLPVQTLSKEVKGKPLARATPTEIDTETQPGWFSRLFRRAEPIRSTSDSSRPPSSGRLDWVIVEDWDEETDKAIHDTMDKKKSPQKGKKTSTDNFVIGVQDWRDPDLLVKSGEKTKTESAPKAASKNNKIVAAEPGKSRVKAADVKTPTKPSKNAKDVPGVVLPEDEEKRPGILSKIFGHGDDEADQLVVEEYDLDDPMAEIPVLPHEGLWVTIIPTSGASPFFDTLLVLVVSPLVTLTVVYALLILRARIRRRRWRAPKSVVERLPVRTYHTVATSPSISSRTPSPSGATSTTPLLQHNHSRTRPRSRTTTGVLESANFLAPSASIPTSSSAPRPRGRMEHEKGASGFSAEWRKYMGRQVECVVCLEEYVDGVSRVMSLPCGHEFHVDCM